MGGRCWDSWGQICAVVVLVVGERTKVYEFKKVWECVKVYELKKACQFKKAYEYEKVLECKKENGKHHFFVQCQS